MHRDSSAFFPSTLLQPILLALRYFDFACSLFPFPVPRSRHDREGINPSGSSPGIKIKISPWRDFSGGEEEKRKREKANSRINTSAPLYGATLRSNHLPRAGRLCTVRIINSTTGKCQRGLPPYLLLAFLYFTDKPCRFP